MPQLWLAEPDGVVTDAGWTTWVARRINHLAIYERDDEEHGPQ